MASPNSFPNALNYLDKVKEELLPEHYVAFLDVMRSFKYHEISTDQVVAKVKELFVGHEELQNKFGAFLPPGYTMTNIVESEKIEQDFGGKIEPESGGNYQFGEGEVYESSRNGEEGGMRVKKRDAEPSVNPLENQKDASFEDARNYVTKVKLFYRDEPHVYKRFLEILHNYHKNQSSMEEVNREVGLLFHANSQLIEGFRQFLPQQENSESHSHRIQSVSQQRNERRIAKIEKIIGQIMADPSISKEEALANIYRFKGALFFMQNNFSVNYPRNRRTLGAKRRNATPHHRFYTLVHKWHSARRKRTSLKTKCIFTIL